MKTRDWVGAICAAAGLGLVCLSIGMAVGSMLQQTVTVYTAAPCTDQEQAKADWVLDNVSRYMSCDLNLNHVAASATAAWDIAHGGTYK